MDVWFKEQAEENTEENGIEGTLGVRALTALYLDLGGYTRPHS